jgi:hypothetical protein
MISPFRPDTVENDSGHSGPSCHPPKQQTARSMLRRFEIHTDLRPSLSVPSLPVAQRDPSPSLAAPRARKTSSKTPELVMPSPPPTAKLWASQVDESWRATSNTRALRWYKPNAERKTPVRSSKMSHGEESNNNNYGTPSLVARPIAFRINGKAARPRARRRSARRRAGLIGGQSACGSSAEVRLCDPTPGLSRRASLASRRLYGLLYHRTP